MKLKPCPICGREPTYWHWNNGFMIECHQEDHRIQCESKISMDYAAEAWNRRLYLADEYYEVYG